ncbi:Rpp20 subunit of nuclear RNase MRP and P-domain-containing protein [Chaetomidium leptoderma]|uniref:Rpp20 subunit of nuclear RNase MRP and P-domain-containing protein n=1 Tax=Chaetomidium leptoderma TaxID=669021 RepID=A0AAN6ZZ54_9PEZI|nr:Rpp20 subunit of nuclear RNase MRP and P-domain-containing protein [Chaetomidium leptoderma]
MASTSPTSDARAQFKTLPNRPQAKLPPIPNGSRIQKRPLAGPSPFSRPRINPSSSSSSNLLSTTADPDGYTPPPRATHTTVIKVSSGATFMSLVRRVRKALEKAPSHQTTKGLPLAARIAALKVAKPGTAGSSSSSSRHWGGIIEDALDDVVLVATGRAIEKAVDVGGFFTREKELVVLVRTRTLQAVDDVVAVDEEADVEDQVRVRNVSCVEVGMRWA